MPVELHFVTQCTYNQAGDDQFDWSTHMEAVQEYKVRQSDVVVVQAFFYPVRTSGGRERKRESGGAGVVEWPAGRVDVDPC